MSYSRYIGCLGRARWIPALAVALAAGLLDSVPAHAAGGHWTVSSVVGVAMVTHNGGPRQPLSPGQPVVAGCTVVTDDDSAVVLTRRGDSITVYPNSEMSIPAASGTDELGVVQSIGKLLFRMETRESQDFEVRTPFLAATIKGTTFTVNVTQTHATVSVAEGSVHVAAARGGRSEMVRPGWSATVEFDREFVDVAVRQKRQTNNPGNIGDSATDGVISGESEPGDSAPGASGSSKSSREKSGAGKSSPGGGNGQGN